MTKKNKLFKIEVSQNRDGVVIWGSHDAFYDSEDLLADCWFNNEPNLSDEESISYVGIMAFFSYEMRHAGSAGRLVKFDGVPLKRLENKHFQLLETEASRFELGLELPWTYMFFVLASWWECFRNRECPQEALAILREMTDDVARALKKTSKSHFKRLSPFLYGAIYAADPYIMHTMRCVKSEVDYRFTYPLRAMAEALEKYAVYNTPEYKDFHTMLDERAAELNCHVADLRLRNEFDGK
jgi:hypothetical protein